MRVLGLYKDIASPWICATVYLWALELRAVISTDSEPVTAWLADCAAILLTLLLWTLIFCLPIALVAGFMGRARVHYLNKLAVKACLIVITALYFVRWLFTLQLYSAEHDVGLIALVIAAAGLAIWAFRRRRTRAIDLEANLPRRCADRSENCWRLHLGAKTRCGRDL